MHSCVTCELNIKIVYYILYYSIYYINSIIVVVERNKTLILCVHPVPWIIQTKHNVIFSTSTIFQMTSRFLVPCCPVCSELPTRHITARRVRLKLFAKRGEGGVSVHTLAVYYIDNQIRIST